MSLLSEYRCKTMEEYLRKLAEYNAEQDRVFQAALQGVHLQLQLDYPLPPVGNKDWQ